MLVDAARRVLRSDAMTAWGIILEPEGGRGNAKLWNWYETTMGFSPIAPEEAGTEPRSMYCPLKRMVPEEWNRR